MKIRPLRDNLLVKQVKKDGAISKSGIITSISTIIENKGEVLRCGADVKDILPSDTILFGQYAGTGIKDDDGVEFLVIKEEEVLAVIEKG